MRDSIHITLATEADLPDILKLQQLAYRSEAELVGDLNIPPLLESLDDLKHLHADGTSIFTMRLKEGQLIGSIRGTIRGASLHIGKLMVHPDHQGLGYGKQLLLHIENTRLSTIERLELFTSNLSKKNLSLYHSMGYSVFRQQASGQANWSFVFMEKNLNNSKGIH